MSNTNTQHKVRWGIAGLGNIAQRFARDLIHHVTNGELYAVAARDLDRAQRFAAQLPTEPSQIYGSYQELANDPNIDAVYVATIHPYHKHLVSLFLTHGKHVLVEKPAFTHLKDWDEMSALAVKNECLLVEAMKSVAFPAYQQLRRFITENSIEINAIDAAFGNWHRFDPTQNIFNSTLSGGATLDVGVYSLWLYVDLCTLTGNTVTQPIVSYENDNTESKVDETVMFHFSGDVQGKIGASITRDLPREAKITGPEVDITIREKWWNPRTIDITYQGQSLQISTPDGGGGFEYEIEHFSSLVLQGALHSAFIPAETSRTVIAIMESALTTHHYQHLIAPASVNGE